MLVYADGQHATTHEGYMHPSFLHTTTFCLMALLGCTNDKRTESSSTGDAETGPYTQFLQGTFETTSPDGSVTYEAVDVLAQRTIDSAAGTIVEDTFHGDEPRTTIFTLQPGTLIFDVTDEDNTFAGTITFESDDWVGSNVTYDLEIFGDYPGSITGTGIWQADTYITDKEFANPMGTIEARTVEVLTVISEEQYAAALPE